MERLRQIQRLAAVRGAQLRFHEGALAKAQAGLLLVEQRIAANQALMQAAATSQNRALASDDQQELQCARAEAEACLALCEPLERMRAAGLRAVEEAGRRVRESRLAAEQVEELKTKLCVALRLEMDRREQAAGDERFAARRWVLEQRGSSAA